MGYKIVYGSGHPQQKKQRFWSGRMQLMTAVCFLLFILSVSMIFQEEFNYLRSIILPGTTDGSNSVLAALVDNLQNDVPLKEAVTAFCRQIISDAGF